MNTTLEADSRRTPGADTDNVAVTVPARELLAMLKKTRANGRPPVPALALTALRFQESGWIEARTFDYGTGLAATLGTPTALPTHDRLVMGNALIHTLTEVARGAGKDLNVTLRWVRDEQEKISRLQLEAEGFELGIPSALASSAHEEYFDTINAWPEPDKTANATATIDVQAFRALLDQVAHATSKDEMLPVLTSINIEFSTDRITATTTDRYRVAMSWIPSRVNFSGNFLLRLTDWQRIRVLFDKPGDMMVHLSGVSEFGAFKELRLSGKDFRVFNKAYAESQFPKVKTLLPDRWEQHIEFSAAAMMRAARVISTVVERNTPLRLESTKDGTAVQIIGQFEEAQAKSPLIPVAGVSEAGIRTAFNPVFYREALKAVAGDKIRISFNETGKPVRVTNAAEPLERLVTEQLVMPVRMPSSGK